MKLSIAPLALLACLFAVPAIALSPAEALQGDLAEMAQDGPTIAIGGKVKIKNNTGGTIIVIVSIDGVDGEPFIIPAGGCETFAVPNDPVLIGSTLRVRASKFMADDDTDYVMDTSYLITKK